MLDDSTCCSVRSGESRLRIFTLTLISKRCLKRLSFSCMGLTRFCEHQSFRRGIGRCKAEHEAGCDAGLESVWMLKWIALRQVERVKFDSARRLIAVRPNSPDKATDRAMRAGLRGPKMGCSGGWWQKGQFGRERRAIAYLAC